MPAQPDGTQPAGRGATGPRARSPGRDDPRARWEGRFGRDASGPREARGRRNPRRSRGAGRWGALQGGLGVCIIVASAAFGTIATMVTRSAPGFLLGLFVEAGTVVAALAVRPRAGRMIFPVPVLSYLVGALISGFVFNRSGTSKTALAIGAAQWVANGFFAMALATVLAVVIITVRWYLWRRQAAGAAQGGSCPGPAGSGGPGAAGRVPEPRRPGDRTRRPARSGRCPGRYRATAPARPRPGTGALQLLQRGVAEHQVLDAVVGTEIDLCLGLVAVTVGRHHRAQAELVVGHHVPRRQRGHLAVPR